MKAKKNTIVQWGLAIVLGIWMAMATIVFLSEPISDNNISACAIIISKVLAALSGWACVKTAQWLDKAGWLPSVDYFATDGDGNEL